MSIIKFITDLLHYAYTKEAEKLQRHAAKLDKAQAKRALAATELAKQASEAIEEAKGLAQEKYHTQDRATGLLNRRDEVAAFFKGESL